MQIKSLNKVIFLSLFSLFLLFCQQPNAPEKNENHSPTITNITFTADTVIAGTNVRVFVIASDPDGDSLYQYWRSDIGEISIDTSFVSWSLPNNILGYYWIHCRVSDPSGAFDEDSARIWVPSPGFNNKPPVIQAIAFSKDTVIAGSEVLAFSSAYEPDGDSLFYHWNSPVGTLENMGEFAKWTLPPDISGRYWIECQAIDSYGATVSDTAYIWVQHGYKVRGWVKGRNPSSIHSVGGATILIPGTQPTSYTSNHYGRFTALFHEIPDTFSVNVKHPDYGIGHKLVYWNTLEQVGPYEYHGLEIQLNQIINYIPLAVGNKWIYNSKYSVTDAQVYDYQETGGSEVWEIISINDDSTSFALFINFDGYKLATMASGELDTVWTGTREATLQVNRNDTTWTATISEEDRFIPGTEIIGLYGLPYRFPYVDGTYTDSWETGNVEYGSRVNISANYDVGMQLYQKRSWSEMISRNYKLQLTDYVIQ